MAATSSDDCYFYYYSSCAKGDACPFRHCPEALGSQIVCSNWRQGYCMRAATCMFRHMEIQNTFQPVQHVQRDRSTIQCYWESQPIGCKKPHCPFKHFNTAAAEPLETTPTVELPKPIMASTPETTASHKNLSKVSNTEIQTTSPKVEPVIFNPFEEESDQESIASGSPMKANFQKSKPVTVPTSGVIKLSKPKPDDDTALNFDIKSLSELESDNLIKAKKILEEAERLLTNQCKDLEEAEQTDDNQAEADNEVSPRDEVAAGENVVDKAVEEAEEAERPTTTIRSDDETSPSRHTRSSKSKKKKVPTATLR